MPFYLNDSFGRAERRGKDGALLATPHQMALLKALTTFRDNTAPSAAEWLETANWFREVIGGHVPGHKGLGQIPAAWVHRGWRGNCRTARLRDRGLEIIRGAVPVRNVGMGVYDPTVPFLGINSGREKKLEER